MDKATPTPASVDSVMEKFHACRKAQLRFDHNPNHANMVAYNEDETAFRAEVERLAAQAARAPAVRMLNQPEIQSLFYAEYGSRATAASFRLADELQRALFRVNAGKRIPASGEIDAALTKGQQ